MEKSKQNIFLNEKIMQGASAVTVLGGTISLIILFMVKDITLLFLFEGIIKIGITLALYWAFSHYQWDFMRGMMGGLLFALMYEEGFNVLGNLWSGKNVATQYLIMGVQGSLYVAAESMSFLMTIIIILNHFVMNYGHKNNWKNVAFNQISILYKIFLYIALAVINIFLELPRYVQITAVIGYVVDVAIIVTVICIESQLEDLKILRQELLKEKKEAERG